MSPIFSMYLENQTLKEALEMLERTNRRLERTNKCLENKLRFAAEHPCAVALANSPLFFEGEINKHLVSKNSALKDENKRLKAELEHFEGICNDGITEEMDAVNEFIEVSCRRVVGSALRAGMRMEQKRQQRFQRQ